MNRPLKYPKTVGVRLSKEDGLKLQHLCDAVLIHAPREELPHAIALTQQCMQQASEAVLAGYRLRTEAKCFMYPEHYQDVRGTEMWQTVQGLLMPGSHQTVELASALAS